MVGTIALFSSLALFFGGFLYLSFRGGRDYEWLDRINVNVYKVAIPIAILLWCIGVIKAYINGNGIMLMNFYVVNMFFVIPNFFFRLFMRWLDSKLGKKNSSQGVEFLAFSAVLIPTSTLLFLVVFYFVDIVG